MKNFNDQNGENDENINEILYQDETIVVTNRYIEINKYYYPLNKKKIIFFNNIKGIQLIDLYRSTGKYKFFGLNWDFSWFHFDRKRPQKEKMIQIYNGSIIKISLTPDDPERVFNILNNFIINVKKD